MATRVTLGPRRNVSVSSGAVSSAGGILRPNSRRRIEIVTSGSAGFTAHGDVAVVTGTAGNTFISAAGGDPSEHLTSITSGAVSGNTAEVRGTTVLRAFNRLTFQAFVRPGPVITVARTLVGVYNAAPLGTDTPGAGGIFGLGFRRSTGVPDTNWQCVTSVGAPINADTVVDSGVVYAASTQYELQIEWEPATYARFSINGAVVATITTTLPVATSLRLNAGLATIEAVAKQFDVAWLYAEKE